MLALASLSFSTWQIIAISFIYGAIIGSFLNVYIYRFHTGKSLAGHSHCLSCGTRLRFFELFPILSYFFLHGRCRTCGCYVPVRYLLVELASALLFVTAAVNATTVLEVLYLWLILSILIVIAVYDLDHYVIPDSLTIFLTLVSLFWLGWQGYLVEPKIILINILAAAGASLFLFSLWAVSKGQWIGFGDVKLAFPLAIIVGASSVFSMIVMSFWIGAAISLLLVGAAKLQGGKLTLRFLPARLTIKSVVPFAPFLIAGCLTVLFFKINVLQLFTF